MGKNGKNVVLEYIVVYVYVMRQPSNLVRGATWLSLESYNMRSKITLDAWGWVSLGRQLQKDRGG